MSLKSQSRWRAAIWVFTGLVMAGSVVCLFEPVQTRLKVRSEIRKWHDRIHRQDASLQGESPGRRGPMPIAANPVPRIIGSDLTLSTAKSPWMISEDVTVQPDCILSLEPGTEVIAADQATLFVFGSLRAEGTSAQPIRIHTLSGSNFWAGIFFGNGSAPSQLRHVEIANAHYGIASLFSEVTLEDCVMRNLREVCSANQSHTVFKNCRILYKDFQLTGNINVFKFYKGTVLVENCEVYCPEADLKIDAFDVDLVDRGIFRGNRIHGSTCQGADGIDVGVRSRDVWIEGNLITGFVDKGVSAGERAEVVVTNTVIARCGMGVGVKDDSRALITHATFYGNGVGVDCYEKSSGKGGGHAEIRHSVFAASTNAHVQSDGLSSLDISDSASDTAPLPGIRNALATFVFEDPDLDLFNLITKVPSNQVGTASASSTIRSTMTNVGAHIMNPGRKP